MQILIVDDEKPARGELRFMLQKLESSATFFEARNGQEALQTIEEEPIDVVFLDINMPGLDGVTTASMMMGRPKPPLIVFATAYDTHAIKAFELAALDYMVKPFQETRLAQTMVRIRETVRNAATGDDQKKALRAYIQQHPPDQPQLEKLWGELENGNYALINYTDIRYIEAVDKKVYACGKDETRLLVRYTIKELEQKLSAFGFARIHKGYLVNLNHIAEVIPYFSGTFLIRLNDSDKTELPMSRQYGKQLKRWLA